MIHVDPFRERVQTLLARVAYKPGAAWRCIEKAPGVLLLQHTQLLPDATGRTYADGAPTYFTQQGRKFYLSPHMTDEEILQTALLSALVFEEHEAREAFRFDGVKLFGPHKSLASLSHIEEAARAE